MRRRLLTGERVVVERPTQTGVNSHQQPVYSWVPETVENVLTASGPRTDIPDTARPAGVVVVWTCHFPKTYTQPLAGCRVSVRGGEPLKVIGDPETFMDVNTPGDWNRPVELRRADG